MFFQAGRVPGGLPMIAWSRYGGFLRRTTLALGTVVLTGLSGCRQQDDSGVATRGSVASVAPAAPSRAESQAALVRVASENVCMVNDQDMEKPQIPVVVGGKTYFGCCAMCKEKLEKNASARTAVDPVSGKAVDKAGAVIARNEAGNVFYFESEETLRRYRP